MEKHNMKVQEKSLSMTELLTALTHAQREREATLDEFRKMSEAEKRRAEAAHTQLEHLETELEEAKNKAEDLNRKQKDLEVLMEEERESQNNLLRKKEEEHLEAINVLKEKVAILQRKLKNNEETNSEISEELASARNKMKLLTQEEENLRTDIKNKTAELIGIKEELNQAVKKYEIAESELHITKMQLLKENNINNRLIDELKRIRKDIEGYRDEIEKLKKIRDTRKNNLSIQIKDLATLITENGKENFDENLREIRISLSSILKENFVLNNKINDVYSILTKTETSLISVSTQTNIGLSEMFSYENMDKEATCLVMRLREDLVSSKNDLIELKHQNETLREMIRNLKKEKEHRELMEEEENRVERLEEAVMYLKQMLKEDENAGTNEVTLLQTLEGMRKDLDKLKDHVIQTTPKQEGEPPDFHFKPFTRPVKLLPTRRLK